MKTFLPRPPIPAVFLCALAILVLGASAHGQADLSFSGGDSDGNNVAPLELTLDAPVVYTVTSTGIFAPLFVFKGTGDVLGGFYDASGTLSCTVNGVPYALTSLRTGFTSGDIVHGDMYTYSGASLQTLHPGDVVVLNAGTLTTLGGVDSVVPADGPYTTYLTDGFQGFRISGDGTAVVPEPSAWVMILGGVSLLGGARLFRRAPRA